MRTERGWEPDTTLLALDYARRLCAEVGEGRYSTVVVVLGLARCDPRLVVATAAGAGDMSAADLPEAAGPCPPAYGAVRERPRRCPPA